MGRIGEESKGKRFVGNPIGRRRLFKKYCIINYSDGNDIYFSFTFRMNISKSQAWDETSDEVKIDRPRTNEQTRNSGTFKSKIAMQFSMKPINEYLYIVYVLIFYQQVNVIIARFKSSRYLNSTQYTFYPFLQ